MIVGTYTTELKCSICKKRCRTENGLQKHFESEHTNLHDSDGIKCERCLKRFKTKAALDSHHCESENRSVTVDENPSKRVNEDDSKGGKRGRRGSSWVDFEMVIKPKKGSRNVQMYKCKLCGTHCFTIKSIHRHLTRDHRQERHVPADCMQCNRTFADEGALRRHITMQHRNRKLHSDNSKKPEPTAKKPESTTKKPESKIISDSIKKPESRIISDSIKKPESSIGDKVRTESVICSSSTASRAAVPSSSKATRSGDENFHCESCALNLSTVAEMCKHLRESHSQRQMHAFLQIVRGYRKFRIYSRKSGDCKYGYSCVNCKKRANSRKSILEHINKEHNQAIGSQHKLSFNPSWSRTSPNAAFTRVAPPSSDSQDISSRPPSKSTTTPLEEGTRDEVSKEASDGKTLAKRRKGSKRYKFSTRKWKPKGSAKDPCRCFDCGVVLKTEWALEQHYKNRHSGPNFQVVPKFSVVKGKYNLFLKCLLCGKICRSKGILKQHLKGHNREEMKACPTPSSPAVVEKEDGNRAKKDDPVQLKGEKRKRNVSCIYHCRVCGKSFPRLFNYSEHNCVPKGNSGKEEKAEGDICDVIPGPSDKPDVPLDFKRARIDDGGKLEKDMQRKSNVVEMKMVSQGTSVVQNTRVSHGKERSARLVRKQATLNRSPRKDQSNLQNKSSSDSEEKLANIAGKKQEGSKFLCRFCRRPFSSQRNLSRHEQLHSEANLLTCSNCGMSFTAVNKLRHHKLRCIQNNDVSKSIGISDSWESLDAFNGRVDGNTYPSFASKREYTYFDPINRPFELPRQRGDPCLDEEANTLEAVGGSFHNGQSSLDNIVIADVRSCNPEFANEKVSVDAASKQTIPIANTPVRGKNVVVPGELVPAYYLDGIQIPYVPIDGISPQNGTLSLPQPGYFTQGHNSHGMYAQGTVFLVPYFVPSQGMLSKDGRALVAPKSGSLPPGGVLMNPNEFNARFSHSTEQGLHSSAVDSSSENHQSSPVDRNSDSSKFHGDRSALKLKDKYDKLNKDKRGKYQCSICNKLFVTFGNYIKHRELHRT